jgi:hypothetical protein
VWMLVLIIAGWVLLRAAAWQPGFAEPVRKSTQTGPVSVRAPAEAELLAASTTTLPPDLRTGLSPEVADQVARELPHELPHQLAIETAREMARQMAPGLAQRLLRERGLDRLVQAPALSGGGGRTAMTAQRPDRAQHRQFARWSGSSGVGRGRSQPTMSVASAASSGDSADYQSFRLPAGAQAEPVTSSAAPTAATPAAAPARKGSWLAMLPELLLHPGRARQILAQNGRSITPSPRFSGDAWFLQRGGSYASILPATPLVAGTPGYGGSQSGAVLRYRLFLEDPHRLSVFLRATSATNTPDREAALGLSARPVGSIPIVLQAEARLQSDGNGTRVRPAVQVVSQFPPILLPLGLRGEAYAAGGYVGGRGATPFYDAQGMVDHHLFGIGQSGRGGGADVRFGVGAWAGGQKGAGRVDVGPRASVSFRVKRIGVRAWRARLHREAAPRSRYPQVFEMIVAQPGG